MGAHGEVLRFDGKLTPEQLKAEWASRCDQYLHEQGHDPYNGTISTMGHGVDVYVNKTFDSVREAEEWVFNTHQKWNNGVAIRARNIVRERQQWTYDGKSHLSGSQPWVYGYSSGQPQLLLADQLGTREKRALAKLVETTKQLERVMSMAHREYDEVQAPLKPPFNAFPPKWFSTLKVKRTALAKALAAHAKSKAALETLATALRDKHCPEREVDQGIVWVAGGWAAC